MGRHSCQVARECRDPLRDEHLLDLCVSQPVDGGYRLVFELLFCFFELPLDLGLLSKQPLGFNEGSLRAAFRPLCIVREFLDRLIDLRLLEGVLLVVQFCAQLGFVFFRQALDQLRKLTSHGVDIAG